VSVDQGANPPDPAQAAATADAEARAEKSEARARQAEERLGAATIAPHIPVGADAKLATTLYLAHVRTDKVDPTDETAAAFAKQMGWTVTGSIAVGGGNASAPEQPTPLPEPRPLGAIGNPAAGGEPVRPTTPTYGEAIASQRYGTLPDLVEAVRRGEVQLPAPVTRVRPIDLMRPKAPIT
jgi:hypothetical protein